MAVFDRPSATARTILALKARRCAVLGRRAQSVSLAYSSSESVTGLIGRPSVMATSWDNPSKGSSIAQEIINGFPTQDTSKGTPLAWDSELRENRPAVADSFLYVGLVGWQVGVRGEAGRGRGVPGGHGNGPAGGSGRVRGKAPDAAGIRRATGGGPENREL